MSTSDVPFVTRRHTRVGIPNIRPICCPIITRIPLRRIKRRGFYLRVRGPCFVLPVRARRAKARERLLSCCEPASRNPQAECRRFFKRSYTRAPIRLLSIRASASGGATDFFLASALSWSPTGLATSRWRRRAMRPTDVCHPNELRVPAPRAFPARSRSFRCGDAPRSLRLRGVLPGDRTFHDVRKTASADRHRTLISSSTASRPGDTSVGVFFPRC
jgi:hypothetical protein